MKNEFILQSFKTAFYYSGHLRGNKAILFITPQPLPLADCNIGDGGAESQAAGAVGINQLNAWNKTGRLKWEKVLRVVKSVWWPISGSLEGGGKKNMPWHHRKRCWCQLRLRLCTSGCQDHMIYTYKYRVNTKVSSIARETYKYWNVECSVCVCVCAWERNTVWIVPSGRILSIFMLGMDFQLWQICQCRHGNILPNVL